MPNTTLQYQVLPKYLTAARGQWLLAHQCTIFRWQIRSEGIQVSLYIIILGVQQQGVVTSWLDRVGGAAP